MVYLFAALILFFCAPVVFVPASRLPLMIGVGSVAFALGAAGLAWANTIGPKFVAEHPALANTPLHPEPANLLGGLLVMFGTGVFLAMAARYVMITMRVMKPR